MKFSRILTVLVLAATASLCAAQTVTTTTLSSSLNPSIYGQAVTFTALVTSSVGAPPDGETVTFLEGKNILGTGTLASGSATFTISTLTTGGTDNIKATYAGDPFFASSTSNTVKQVVDAATTTTALTSSPNPSTGGQAVTLTATVTGQYGGTVTGKVTFNNGTTKLGTALLSAGVTTFTTSSLPGGTDPITAVYGGNDLYVTSTSPVLNQVVNGGTGGTVTTTVLSSSLNPSIYGQAVTFTAVVSPAPPNGETVTFMQGKDTVLGTETLTGGTATLIISTLTTGGTDAIHAVYPGDTNLDASTSNTVKQVVDKCPTSTALISAPNPSQSGQPVTFTATVTPQYSGTVTGNVTFYDGSTKLGVAFLTGGVASHTTSNLPGGTDPITAVYGGSSSYLTSTSPILNQTVSGGGGGGTATTTTLSSSLNPSVYGQTVTFTAAVSSKTGPPPDGEPVSFMQGKTALGTGTLSGGSATFSISTLATGGSDPIQAVYAGDSTFSASTSNIVKQVVSQATTTTTVASSQNPSIFGQSVTLTAAVAPEFGGTVSGTVEFENAGKKIGTASLAGGVATFQSTSLAAGSNSISAAYNGSSSFAASNSATLSQIVNPASTTTTLVSSVNPSNFGQAVTFTATVTPQYSGFVSGSVTFYDNGTLMKSGFLNGSGMAKLVTTALAAGSDVITATYNGSTDFTSSTASVTQTVNGGTGGGGTFIDTSMVWNGVTRYYEVYLPANLPANPPLLLMLHGTRTTPDTGSDPTPVITLNWGWTPVADQYKFILVKPASTYDPASHAWNWNAYCMDGTASCAPYGSSGGAFPYAQDCGSTDGECPDDIGFLRALIAGLTKLYSLNPNMVYVAGFSSGAEMTERVGVELSDVVAAIGPASGQLVAVQGIVPPPLPLPPHAQAPISVQEWHGTLDTELPPCNFGTTKYSGVTFTLDTVDDTFNYWSGAQANACKTFQTTQPLCLDNAANPNVPSNDATGCTGNVEVQFIWEVDVEHSWQQQNDDARWLFFAAHPKQGAPKR